MGMYKYITNRTFPNAAGEMKGRLRVLVKNDSNTADIDYTCAECGQTEQMQQEWKRPFNVKCSKCGALMSAPKLKGKKK